MSWIFGNKNQKYIANLEKNNKIREENKDTFVIGNISPQTKEKFAIENDLIQEGEKTKTKQDSSQKDILSKQDQLFVINNAKIKMGSHMGTFKVLNNTPTIQGKTVGTKVEKSPANFSFLDGFQILSVTGDWQDIGTAKYQDNEALIKKSTLMVTGKMPPPNAPIETGKIEFIDSGQINIPENINTTGMPVPKNVNSYFDIEIKLIKDNFVPLGITDFKGRKENDCIQFKYKVIGSEIDSIEWEVSGENITYKEIILPEVVVSYKKSKKEEIKEEKSIAVGEYILYWDGFDNNDIYDSTRFKNKRLKVKITAIKGEQKRTDEIEIKPKYNEVDWVDVRIDKNAKRIDAALRVNLRDGGTRGLKCTTYDIDPEPKIRVENKKCPWDKIPKDILDYYKKEPIKTRTKTYEELRTMALQGIDKYWSRHADNIGKGVQIGDDFYEVFVKAVNTEEQAMDDIPLIYNTNNKWSRSGNPGGSYDDMNLDDDIIRLLPDGIIQRISYNVGYIQYANWKDLDTSHWLYKLKGWEYYGEIFENENFKETSAHEVGHEILQAIAGTTYSWQHKGSSYYLPQDTKPLEGEETFWDKVTHWDEMDTHGENYPAFGEIDLMKYYNGDKPKDFHKRIIATERDVLGLIWLSKIKIL